MAVASSRLGSAARQTLGIRNYRLLCVGQGASLLGEQVNLVGLSWLALQVSGNALALGSVLAVAGLPPALLVLFSGVVTDRFTPRAILLIADSLRLALAAALVALILTGSTSMGALYAVALGFGLSAALAMPAISSIVPTLVPRELLLPANSLHQALAQLALVAGPALAGLVIAAGPKSSTAAIAPAFVIYGITLVVSVVTLRLMDVPRPAARSRMDARTVLASIVNGWQYAWRDALLRRLVPVILALNFLLAGPLAVGVPVLARERLPEGAAAFGLLAAGWGAGNLTGALAASASRKTRGVGLLLTATFFGFAAGLAALAWLTSTWLGVLLVFVVGAGNGYLGVIVRTLLHRRTPAALLGRVISVYLFARTLLVPLSQTLSGAAIEISLQGLFAGAAVLLGLLALWLARSAAPRLLEQELEVARRETATTS